MDSLIPTIYFGGAAAWAAYMVWLGSTDRWSKDDWPIFAILTPWFWPLMVPGIAFGELMARREQRALDQHMRDNPHCICTSCLCERAQARSALRAQRSPSGPAGRS